MNAINDLIATNSFVTAALLAKAIEVVKSALSAPADTEDRQEILDRVYEHIDQMLVRDFSGEVTVDTDDLILICKNAFEPYDMAVELYSQNGDVCFYYLDAEAALRFLSAALANIGKQVANPHANQTAPIKKALTTRKYKTIYKAVIDTFNSQVVDMLGQVADKDLSLEAATQDGDVFADKVTDALFFAWAYNHEHPAIAKGCVYDYIASGDGALLSSK
jgi:hypothetical protein